MKRRFSTGSLLIGLLLCLALIVLQIFRLSLISNSNNLSLFPIKAPSERSRGKVEVEKKGDPLALQSWQQTTVTTEISCNRSRLRYDLCKIDGPTVLDPTTATFFAMGSTSSTNPPLVEKIRPYPRKFEDFIMGQIKNITLISGSPSPLCEVQHNVPALVFTAGGYTGNFYHDFNDGFIPLFITVNTILFDQDFVIVVSEAPDWWSSKYEFLLRTFTKHSIITLENNTATHCFPSANLGLISHGFMTINHKLLPNSKTYRDFRRQLHYAFGHNVRFLPKYPKLRPRLVLTYRNVTNGRMLINLNKTIRLMEKIGFEIILFEPIGNTSLHESYELINSCHSMIGIHGAALTHALFLRPGAVLVQIVPIGVEWAADVYFGRVARGLSLEYMEYKIGVEESSLVDKYGKDNLLLKDPHALQKNGWPAEIMDIYLREQNVKLDLVRFKEYLVEAYKKAKKFMHKRG